MRTLAGERRGSLLAAIDRTVTAAGSRLLAQRLAAPLTDPAAIARRHDAVAHVRRRCRGARAKLRERLKAAPDLARALSRLVVGRGGPRDLAAIRDGIAAAATLAARLDALAEARPPRSRTRSRRCAARMRRIARELAAALADELPLFKRDGGFVRAGYDAALDETRALRDESRRVIAALQARYADETGVRALKIRHNNVLGYFVEVTAQHGDKLMARAAQRDLHPPPDAGRPGALHHHRAGRAGSQDRQRRRSRARHRARDLRSAAARVIAASDGDQGSGGGAGALDVAAALAQLAVERDYVRPEIDDSLDFVIEGGRHPVVEQALAQDGEPFVANDCDLSPPPASGGAGRIWLLTGPNMAGKSTFLRQNALIAMLAQMGSFVPARARADRRRRPPVLARRRRRRSRARPLDLHGRDGGDRRHPQSGGRALAGDPRRDRARHRDLRRPLDRLGDVEHLHEVNRCRALFATHFHELTALVGQAAAPAQRHRAGEGMAGRGRVPARGRAGRRRPLLRHPGREARRPAAER